MMLGARTAAWSGGKQDVNPYADPSTFYMIDGIWNGGVGIHDKSMQGDYLVNCIDGSHIIVVNNNSKPLPWITFEDKFIFYNSNVYLNNILPYITSQNCDEMTIEMVVNSDNPAARGWLYLPITEGGFFLVGYNNNQTYVNGGAFSHPDLPYGSLHHIALTTKFGRQALFVDGEIIATSDKTPTVGRNISKVCFYGSYNSGNGIVGGRFGAIRVSNRCMTDDEIIKRYAIDKARFGLP